MAFEFYSYIILLAGGILLGIARYRRLSVPFRILLALLFATLLDELIARWLAYHIGTSCPVYHFYVLISFWLYSFIFQSLYKKSKTRFTVLFLTIPFTVFSIVNSVLFEKLREFPSHAIMVSNILLVIYALVFFKQLLELKSDVNVVSKSYFWFSAGMLFYFSVQIFDWGLMNYLIKKGGNAYPLIWFGTAASIIFYVVLGACLYLDSRPDQPSGLQKNPTREH